MNYKTYFFTFAILNKGDSRFWGYKKRPSQNQKWIGFYMFAIGWKVEG